MERIRILEIKKLVSTILLTIGISGLLYCFPSFYHPGFKHIMGISILSIFVMTAFLLGLISKIFYSKRGDNARLLKYSVLIPNDSNWKKSIRFAIISITLLGTLLIFTNPTPGYAPHSYAHNVGFMIPIFLTSFGYCIAGFVAFIKIDSEQKGQLKWIHWIIQMISVFPFLIFVFLIFLNS